MAWKKLALSLFLVPTLANSMTIDEAINCALENNPVIKRAGYQLEIAQQEKKLQDLEYGFDLQTRLSSSMGGEDIQEDNYKQKQTWEKESAITLNNRLKNTDEFEISSGVRVSDRYTDWRQDHEYSEEAVEEFIEARYTTTFFSSEEALERNNQLKFSSETIIKQVEVKKKRNDVALDVAIRYFEILGKKEGIELQNQHIDHLNHLQLLTKLPPHKSDLNLQQVKSAIEKAKSKLLKYESKFEEEVAKFQDVLFINESIEIEESLSYKPEDRSLDYFLQSGIEKDFELTMLKERKKVLEDKATKLQKTRKGLPMDISIKGDFFPETQEFSSAVTVNFNFSGKQKSKEESAKASRELSIVDLDLSIREKQLRTEIENTYQNIKTLEKRIEITQTNMEQAESNLREAFMKYGNGEISYIEVTEIITQLTEINNDYIEALVEHNKEKTKLTSKTDWVDSL